MSLDGMFEVLFKLANKMSDQYPIAKREGRIRRIRRRTRRAIDTLTFRAKKPDHVSFVIGGAQKSGTTALDAYLRHHPQVCMGDKKEIRFFEYEPAFLRRRVNYNLFHAHFSPRTADCILGDASPDYVFWPEAIRRIYTYDPAMKWIVLLREPVARAYSAWNMQRFQGKETLSFHDAIHADSVRCLGSLSRVSGTETYFNHNYIYRGFYAEQIRRLWRYFPKEQTLILKSSDLRAKTVETLGRVADFLKIPPFPPFEATSHNVTPYNTEIDEADRRYLKDVYLYEIKELERMLNWDLKSWME